MSTLKRSKKGLSYFLRSTSGQGSVEWIGLFLVVTMVIAASFYIFKPDVRPIAYKISCAMFDIKCGEMNPVDQAYGSGTASLVRKYAPNMVHDKGNLTLPVDYRQCRSRKCSDSSGSLGAGRHLSRSDTGLQPKYFVHVVRDDRSKGGYLYLQYWFYYPDSDTRVDIPASSLLRSSKSNAKAPPTTIHMPKSSHNDDWEGYQVRIDASGKAEARSSAHDGYAGRHEKLDMTNEVPWDKVSDKVGGVLNHTPLHGAKPNLGRLRRGSWAKPSGWTKVTYGSHAGHVPDGRGGSEDYTLRTDVGLIPVELLDPQTLQTDFGSGAPPWQKTVYCDPGYNSTNRKGGSKKNPKDLNKSPGLYPELLCDTVYTG